LQCRIDPLIDSGQPGVDLAERRRDVSPSEPPQGKPEHDENAGNANRTERRNYRSCDTPLLPLPRTLCRRPPLVYGVRRISIFLLAKPSAVRYTPRPQVAGFIPCHWFVTTIDQER
jgi:hypothetical protein